MYKTIQPFETKKEFPKRQNQIINKDKFKFRPVLNYSTELLSFKLIKRSSTRKRLQFKKGSYTYLLTSCNNKGPTYLTSLHNLSILTIKLLATLAQ